MRKLISSILCILFAGATGAGTRAEVLTLNGAFGIVESDALYEISLSTGGSFPARLRVTGSIPVSFTFDTETLEVTELRIRGFGLITWETFGFNIYSSHLINEVELVTSTIKATFQNLGMEVRGNGDTIRVDPRTGALNTSDFVFLLNRGEASAGIEIEGISTVETFYYNEDPEETFPSDSPVVTVEKIRDDLYERQYHFSLNLNLSDSDTTTVDGTNLSITTTENVKLVARLIYEEPTAFGRWYEFNRYHYDGENLDSQSATGIPMYLAFALGHEHYLNEHQKPFDIYSFEGETYFSVISPVRRDDVLIVASATLEEGSWTPIPAEWLVSGLESLKPDSRRNILVKLPRDSTTRFFRVVASPPEFSD